MKKKYNRISLLVCTCLLAGCVINQKPVDTTATEDYVNKNIETALTSVQLTQKELYQYGAVNNQKTGVSGGIYTDSQRIELNWNGDASQLLSQLASQRNYRFLTSGVKLPLPVSLKVQGAEYRDVVELVQTQIDYRAGIIVDNTRRQMILRYNSPVSDLRDGQVQTVTRGASTAPATPAYVRPRVKQPAPVTKTGCDAACPTNDNRSFFRSGGSVQDSIGTSCSPDGQLGRDINGQPLSCKKGKWAKLN